MPAAMFRLLTGQETPMYIWTMDGGPPHRMGCQLWLVNSWGKPSWPVSGGIHSCQFISFFLNFEQMTSILRRFFPCLCLKCNGHFIDMRCFSHLTSERGSVSVYVCVYCLLFICAVCASLCVTSVRLCGRTYQVNASQFIFYIHVMQYDTSTILLV